MIDVTANQLSCMAVERQTRQRVFFDAEDRFWYDVYRLTENGFPVSEAARIIGCTRQHVRQRTIRYRDQEITA